MASQLIFRKPKAPEVSQPIPVPSGLSSPGPLSEAQCAELFDTAFREGRVTLLNNPGHPEFPSQKRLEKSPECAPVVAQRFTSAEKTFHDFVRKAKGGVKLPPKERRMEWVDFYNENFNRQTLLDSARVLAENGGAAQAELLKNFLLNSVSPRSCCVFAHPNFCFFQSIDRQEVLYSILHISQREPLSSEWVKEIQNLCVGGFAAYDQTLFDKTLEQIKTR